MTENNNVPGNIVTNVGDREIVMERIFDAPRALVFKVFTEPKHVAQWWAPVNFTIPFCTIDLRPGGIWHYCNRSPEGDELWIKSVYREIIEPERIVYTTTFADKDANPLEGIPEQLGTVTFREHEGKTKLTTRFQFSSADDLKATLDMGMIEGLTETFNNLFSYLKEIQS